MAFLSASSATFAVNVLGAAALFGMHITLARVLGPASYGAFYLTVAWVTILALAGKAGLDTAATRFTAAYVAAGDWPRLKGLFGFTQGAVASGGLIAGGVFALAATLLSGVVAADVRAAFFVGAACIPVLALLQTGQAALIGLHRYVPGIILERLAVPLAVAVLVLTAGVAFGRTLHAYHAVAVYGAVLTVFLLVLTVWLWRAVPVPARAVTAASEKRTWLVTALPLAVLSATHLVLSHVDTVMVGAFLDAEAAGRYGVAARLSALVLFGLIAVNGVAAPLISRHHSQGEAAALRRLAILTARIGLAFALVAGLGLVLLGEWALSFFGDTFTASYGVLLIIMISHVINAAAGPVGVLMTMTGGERPAALAMLAALAANVVLNAVLIPAYGIEGAAAATVASTALWNGLLLNAVRGRLGFAPLAVARGG
jgi:O-antigen/teichoic acid export membrane protein